jgi:proliferating cell nuclear antigen
MSKVLKTMGKDDSLTIRVNDDSDSIIIAMESQSKFFKIKIVSSMKCFFFLDQDKFADYELRLMDLDSEHLGIPDTDYSCAIKMPSGEFSRICRDMSIMGDSVLICTTKEGVKFSAKGDLGQGRFNLSMEFLSLEFFQVVFVLFKQRILKKKKKPWLLK